MRKIIALLLMLITLIPCSSTGIDIRTEGTIHHGGARMPSMTRVAADYEDDVITIDVTGYSGSVQVYIVDANGNNVNYTCLPVYGRGSIALNTSNLEVGDYTLYIVLDNAIYTGDFTK